MKFRNFSFLFVIVILAACLSSCHDNDAPNITPEVLLSLDASTRMDLAQTDTWFFISDENGKVLNVVHDTIPGIVTFQGTTPHDTLTLTWVRNFGTRTEPNLMLNSFSGIPKGSSLNLNPIKAQPVPVTHGSFDLTITSSPNTETKLSIGGFFMNFVTTALATPFHINPPLFADTSSLLVAGYTVLGGPVYKFYHGVGNGTNISLTFDDLKPYPNTITLPPTTYNANCYGLDPVSSRMEVFFNGILNYPEGDYTRKIGYLPGYQSYYLNVDTHPTPDITASYIKRGSINPAPTIPSVTISKNNVSIEHADIRINRPASWSTILYFHNTPTAQQQWIMNSPYGHHVEMTALPEALVTRFPMLRIADFEYGVGFITETISQWKYEDFVVSGFQGTEKPEFEIYNYSFN